MTMLVSMRAHFLFCLNCLFSYLGEKCAKCQTCESTMVEAVEAGTDADRCLSVFFLWYLYISKPPAHGAYHTVTIGKLSQSITQLDREDVRVCFEFKFVERFIYLQQTHGKFSVAYASLLFAIDRYRSLTTECYTVFGWPLWQIGACQSYHLSSTHWRFRMKLCDDRCNEHFYCLFSSLVYWASVTDQRRTTSEIRLCVSTSILYRWQYFSRNTIFTSHVKNICYFFVCTHMLHVITTHIHTRRNTLDFSIQFFSFLYPFFSVYLFMYFDWFSWLMKRCRSRLPNRTTIRRATSSHTHTHRIRQANGMLQNQVYSVDWLGVFKLSRT